MYMQYFRGFSSFTKEATFSAPHFVDKRKRMSLEFLSEIINKIIKVNNVNQASDENVNEPNRRLSDNSTANAKGTPLAQTIENSGKLLMDATAVPQCIHILPI